MRYFSPTQLSDALEILAQSQSQPGHGKILAGGTDVYPSAKQGHKPAYYLDVTQIDGLSTIQHTETGTYIGAAVTWNDVVEAPLPPAFDALKAAGREVGSIQIQNAGTLVGNLCNASPAADGVPPLLALDASVEIESAARGKRTVGLANFITGVREKDLAVDEIVSGIRIPRQAEGMQSAFEKLGSRKYLVISICMTAAQVRLDADGAIAEAKIAVGACSAVAQRLTILEAALVGCRPIDVEISDAHLVGLSPIDDVRGSSEFRLDVVKEQIRRVVEKAAKP